MHRSRMGRLEWYVRESLSSLMSERSDITPRLGLLTSNPELAKGLSLLAYDYGFRLTPATTSSILLEMASQTLLDLILVDLSEDKVENEACCDVVRQCVEDAALPTIALSSRTEEAARICALDKGAEDYVLLPFSNRELATRVLRILSRTKPDLFDRPLTHGDILMDVADEKVFRGGEYVRLKPAEFKILHALMQRPQEVVSREELLAAVFGNPNNAAARTIDVYVLRLRHALSSPEPGSIIRTVRPAGYSLDKDTSTSGR